MLWKNVVYTTRPYCKVLVSEGQNNRIWPLKWILLTFWRLFLMIEFIACYVNARSRWCHLHYRKLSPGTTNLFRFHRWPDTISYWPWHLLRSYRTHECNPNTAYETNAECKRNAPLTGDTLPRARRGIFYRLSCRPLLYFKQSWRSLSLCLCDISYISNMNRVANV